MEDSKVKNAIKNKAKKLAIKIGIKILVIALLVVVVAASVMVIFSTVRDKMIELASNIKTTVTNFWKWFTDDYWIKLDKEVEFAETDPDTRTRYYSKKNISR